MSDNVTRYPALTRAFRQIPERHNTPELNKLSDIFLDTSTHSHSSTFGDVRRKASQHKPAIQWFRGLLARALEDDLKPIQERCGKKARDAMIQAIFNQLRKPLDKAIETDLPEIQRITSELKTKSDEDALDTWCKIFDERELGNLHVFESNANMEARVRPLNDALRTVIATKLPGYSPVVHEWVKDRVIELTGRPVHDVNPDHCNKLVHHVRMVTAWVRRQYSQTDDSKGPRYRLTDRTETSLLERHWNAEIEIDQLRELYSKTPGGLSFEEAKPLVFAAKEALLPPDMRNETNLNRAARDILWIGAGHSQYGGFLHKKETIGVIRERLDAGGWTENDINAEIDDLLKFAANPARFNQEVGFLKDIHKVDLSDISHLDFVDTQKIDTPRKLEGVIRAICSY